MILEQLKLGLVISWCHEVYAYVIGAAETGSGDPAEKGIG